jgi:hypothetical protein
MRASALLQLEDLYTLTATAVDALGQSVRFCRRRESLLSDDYDSLGSKTSQDNWDSNEEHIAVIRRMYEACEKKILDRPLSSSLGQNCLPTLGQNCLPTRSRRSSSSSIDNESNISGGVSVHSTDEVHEDETTKKPPQVVTRLLYRHWIRTEATLAKVGRATRQFSMQRFSMQQFSMQQFLHATILHATILMILRTSMRLLLLGKSFSLLLV